MRSPIKIPPQRETSVPGDHPLEDLLQPIVDMIAEAVVDRLQRDQKPRLMTIRDVSQTIQRSERYVRQEIADGRLECVRQGNSRPRIEPAALDRWIAQNSGRE